MNKKLLLLLFMGRNWVLHKRELANRGADNLRRNTTLPILEFAPQFKQKSRYNRGGYGSRSHPSLRELKSITGVPCSLRLKLDSINRSELTSE